MAPDPDTEPRQPAASHAFAWAATALGGVVVGGFTLVLWAFTNGELPNIAISAYHLPLYLGVLAVAVVCAVTVVRASRDGRTWRRALPRGYGVLGVGVALFVAALVLDVGWREGVGYRLGIEESLSPSRIALAIALGMITVAPLHSALIGARVPAIAVALSSAFTLAAVGWPGGFHPAESQLLAVDPDLPQLPSDIWVMDADGSHQTRLIEAGAATGLGYTSWSPDGREISYTLFQLPPGGGDVTEAEIWAARSDGTGSRRILEGPEWAWIPRFTPDGQAVLYTDEAPGGPFTDAGPLGPGVGAGPQGPLSIPLPNADVWSIGVAADSEPRQLTDSAGDDRAPVPSPDGSRILFDSTRDGNTEIYVMDADGANPQRLTDDAGEDWGASWSPDGMQIAFNSSRTGAMEIFVMDADGDGVRQVTFEGGFCSGPTWSPDGSRIAFTARGDDGAGQIWSVAADGSDRQDLSRNVSTDDQVWTSGWGADGRILFVRTPQPGPLASALVRLDYAAAGMLLSVVLLATMVAILALTAPPLGSFTLFLVVGTALIAIPAEAWFVVPAGAAAGMATDLAAWRSAPGRRPAVAAATAAGSFVLATSVAALLTRGLEWTPTLALGVALAAGVIGWAIGTLAEMRPREATASA